MITEALRQQNTFTSVKILKLHYSHFSYLPAVGAQRRIGASLQTRSFYFTLNCNICNVLENCQACLCYAAVSLCSHRGNGDGADSSTGSADACPTGACCVCTAGAEHKMGDTDGMQSADAFSVFRGHCRTVQPQNRLCGQEAWCGVGSVRDIKLK